MTGVWTKILCATILCSLFLPSLGNSQYPFKKDQPSFPASKGYVSDFAGILSNDWYERIRGVCKELETRTGVEMMVVTVETIRPQPHAREYASKMYGSWRIGTAQQERGILLLTSVEERQAVVVLGKSLLSVISKPQLDEISTQHLIPMYQSAQFGEELYQAAVGLASASSNVPKDLAKKKSSSKGFWMKVIVALAMIYTLWRFTRPERRHPFQRWRKGEYWATGQGGFGGNFGGFGGGGSGQGLS